MGLDMYLEVKEYLSDFEGPTEYINAIKENNPHGLGDFLPTYVTFELAYWRKANAIHGWFDRNVNKREDECYRVHVTYEHLVELKEICDKVLKDPKLAPELLPTTKGFFFGSYEYDEHYQYDVARTAELLEKIVSNPNAKNWWIVYKASW